MSALTPIRRPGTDAAINLIVQILDNHRFEGDDIATILYAAHDSMEDCEYEKYGTQSLEELADQMIKEIRANA